MRTHVIGLLAATLLGSVGSAALASSRIPQISGADRGAGDNWSSVDADAAESGYSRLAHINRSNVKGLRLAWWLDLPGSVTLEATPLAVNGVLYFTNTYSTVYALRATDGRVLWTFDPQTWKYDPSKMHNSFAANRGVAYAHGRVFAAALDGRLFALDARTGKLLWCVDTVPRHSAYYVTGAPRVFDGKVIIGNGGADFGMRGYITAYDQVTGARVWRFYTAPGSPAQDKGHPALERAAKTWSGPYWKVGTGGGPWDDITFDRKLNRIYFGTGNAGPDDPAERSPGGGRNLYTASIVALDADTGKLIWYYQVAPRDAWDYDSTQQISLATLDVGGKRRKILMQASKDGFFYVIDRVTGKLVSATKIGKVTWASRIDLKTGLPAVQESAKYWRRGAATVWPAAMGAHSWQAMSFDPKTGLVYIPYMQEGLRFKIGTEKRGFNVGSVGIRRVTHGPRDGKGALLAWDPVRGRAVWSVWHKTIWNGGAMATAGDLVFQGTADGYVDAYDAASGRRLWRFYAGMGVIAAPMAYMAGGKQYVSILVGYGGSSAVWGSLMNAGWKFSEPRRLLTFALGGRAVLPSLPRPEMTVRVLPDPGLKIDPAAVAKGHALFEPCAVCHGLNLVSGGGPAPDLLASPVALNPDLMYAVVHDGRLMEHGMPQFANLTHGQIMDIYAYIRATARSVLATQNRESVRRP